MASNSVTAVTPSIADSLGGMLGTVCEIQAMLQGVAALLQAHEEEGKGAYLWAAQEIVKATIPWVESIYVGHVSHSIIDRVRAMEGGAA